MGKPVVDYVEKTLTSGRAVLIRARTYAEWEAQEEARLKAMEGVPDSDVGHMRSVAALQRAQGTVQAMRLSACVKDFDKLKKTLSMRDIAEIEEFINQEESLGNSAAGGDGQ